MNITKLQPFSIEEVRQYIQSESVFQAPETALKRFHVQGNRFYYVVQGEGPEREISPFYPSVTTIADEAGLESSEGLKKYFADSRNYSQVLWDYVRKSQYGTFFHLCTANMLQRMVGLGRPDIRLADADLWSILSYYSRQLGYQEEFAISHWLTLNKDLTAFSAFCIHFDLRPFFIEKTLIHGGKKYAGTTDIGANIEVSDEEGYSLSSGGRYKGGANYRKLKPGVQTRRTNILIDIKTGYYHTLLAKYVVQLELLKQAFEFNFPKVTIEDAWIWKPTEWGKTPGYWIGERKGHFELNLVDSYLEIAKTRLSNVDRWDYKTEIGGGYLITKDTETSQLPEIRTLSCREAIELYERTKTPETLGVKGSVELGVLENRQMQIEFEVDRMLGDAFATKALVSQVA